MTDPTRIRETDKPLAIEEVLGSFKKEGEFSSDVRQFRRTLRKFSKMIVEAFTTVRRENDEGIAHRYCWDWEMIRELIEYEFRGTYFAAALMIALRSCMKQGEKILVLEGAKREAAAYLQVLVSRERKERLKRTKTKGMTEDMEIRTGVFKHPSWRNDLAPKLATLKKQHMPAYVLEWFLAHRAVAAEEYVSEEEIRNTITAPSTSDRQRSPVPQNEFARYLAFLSQSRRYAVAIRNESDAANLALMSVIGDKTDSIKWRLVTGTRVLRRLKSESTISPIAFAVITALRDEFNTPQDLEKYLNSCNARISQLWEELGVNEQQLTSDARDMSRQDIAHIGRLLAYLQQDPILERLLDIIASATVSAANQFDLVQEEITERAKDLMLDPEINISDYEMLVSTVTKVYERLSDGRPVTAEMLGIQWDSRPAEIGLAKQWKLRGGKGSEILTVDVYNDCYCVYWDTQVSVGQFVDATRRMLAAVGKNAAKYRVVFCNSPSVDVPIEGKLDLKSVLAAIEGNEQIVRIVIITTLGDFYYGVPSVDRAAFERVFFEEDVEAEFGFEASAKVAVVSNVDDLSLFETLYKATYVEFLPSGFLAREVKARLCDTGWQCDMKAQAEKDGST